jgi:hypothetical protein
MIYEEISMDANSIINEDDKIHNLTNEYQEANNGSDQDVIVVDGRSYENNSQEKKEIHNLVDVIEDTRNADKMYEEILKRSEDIVRKIALKIVPEIAERIIKEEIEKIRKTSDAE